MSGQGSTIRGDGTNRPSATRPLFIRDKIIYNVPPGPTPQPSVTINKSATQVDPTVIPYFAFDIHFSESVSDFVAADVTLVSTAADHGTLQRLLTGSGTDYVLQVKYTAPFDQVFDWTGTLTATIAAGVATGDVSGLPTTASTSVDNVISYSTEFTHHAFDSLTIFSHAFIDMVKIGDSLFVSENNQAALISVEVTDPGTPTVTQELDPVTGGAFNASQVSGIATDGTQVFLGSAQQLRVMDVSDPAAMDTIGTSPTEATSLLRVDSIVYDNGHCYCGVSSARFAVVDVDPATTPTVVGAINTVVHSQLSIGGKIGDYVFGLSALGLVSFDVADPTNPAVADLIAHSLTGHRAGYLLVLADLDLVVFSGSDATLYFVDVSDPTDMQEIAAFTSPIFMGNFVQNNFYYVLDRWDANRIVVAGGGGGYGPMLFDISDPSDPQMTSASPGVFGLSTGNRLIADPPYVYLLDQADGLYVSEYIGP